MEPDFLQQLKMHLWGTLSQRETDAVLFWIIEETTGLSRTDVITKRLSNIDCQQAEQLRNFVGRVAKGEPVQYVLGYTDFCGLRIGVEPGVLIPRPETEDLVHLCTEQLPSDSHGKHPCIIDLCTGSGCIALAMKHLIPNAIVEGWDISGKALETAQKNAADLDLDVTFRKVDVLNPASPSMMGSRREATLLVSNPPYVCESERAEMERNVLEHEPSLALFVPDDDPLRFYRAIAQTGQRLLQPGGKVVVEINQRFGHEVITLFESSGYIFAAVLKDRYGKDRFVLAHKK